MNEKQIRLLQNTARALRKMGASEARTRSVLAEVHRQTVAAGGAPTVLRFPVADKLLVVKMNDGAK